MSRFIEVESCVLKMISDITYFCYFANFNKISFQNPALSKTQQMHMHTIIHKQNTASDRLKKSRLLQ